MKTLLCAIMLGLTVRASQARQPGEAGRHVEIAPADIMAGSDAGPFARELDILAGDARVASEDLPVGLRRDLAWLEARILPRIDVDVADPRDLIPLILSRPIPPHRMRLSGIDVPSPPPRPPWVESLTTNGLAMRCCMTNAPLLPFAIELGRRYGWSLALDRNEGPVFVNEADAHASPHLYRISFTGGMTRREGDATSGSPATAACEPRTATPTATDEEAPLHSTAPDPATMPLTKETVAIGLRTGTDGNRRRWVGWLVRAATVALALVAAHAVLRSRVDGV